MLLAIDSRGDCIRAHRVPSGSDEECAVAWLEGLIEHYDPLPQAPDLKLLKPAVPPPPSRALRVALLCGHARLR